MKILLCISGGIAVYKSCEIVRLLRKSGDEVKVAMTVHATHFVTPLTFETLSGNRVVVDQFDSAVTMATEHITLARWADRIVVAPATANILAKFAAGIADDFISTVFLAATCPIDIFPAMNTAMFEHQLVKRNIAVLRGLERVSVYDPCSGELACAETGIGKLPPPEEIVERITGPHRPPKLPKRHCLITAGPTRAYFDPVRFISNPSSGKMGVALAFAAAMKGWEVTLVHGPIALSAAKPTVNIPVETASEMYEQVDSRFDHCDIFIACAAVNDFKPVEKLTNKIKKTGGKVSIEFIPEIDILKSVSERKHRGQILVGFCAETDHHLGHARKKMKEKHLDLMVVNDISDRTIGFGSSENEVQILDGPGQPERISKRSKEEVARIIVDRIDNLLEINKCALP